MVSFKTFSKVISFTDAMLGSTVSKKGMLDGCLHLSLPIGCPVDPAGLCRSWSLPVPQVACHLRHTVSIYPSRRSPQSPSLLQPMWRMGGCFASRVEKFPYACFADSNTLCLRGIVVKPHRFRFNCFQTADKHDDEQRSCKTLIRSNHHLAKPLLIVHRPCPTQTCGMYENRKS